MIKECEKYGISSAKEVIDESIAGSIEAMYAFDVCLFRVDEFDYIYLKLNTGLFKIVKQIEMVESEKALATVLVLVVAMNVECRQRRADCGKKPHQGGWESAMGRIRRFIDEMHDAGRYRFCSFFAQILLRERINGCII